MANEYAETLGFEINQGQDDIVKISAHKPPYVRGTVITYVHGFYAAKL
jgi:hypothetical protein